jgi:hypothetical protein
MGAAAESAFAPESGCGCTEVGSMGSFGVVIVVVWLSGEEVEGEGQGEEDDRAEDFQGDGDGCWCFHAVGC